MACCGAAVGVGVTLVMVSGGSAVADGALLALGAARHWDTARRLLVDGDTVADVVPLSPPLRIISVPADGDEQHDARDAGHPQPVAVVVVGVVVVVVEVVILVVVGVCVVVLDVGVVVVRCRGGGRRSGR